jgi:hypothetical protein
MRRLNGLAAPAIVVRTTAALTGLVFLLAGVAACGGDEPITKEDYVVEVNQICREANEDAILAAGESLPENPDADDIRTYWNETARPSIEERIDEIRAVEVPEGDEDVIDSYLAALEDGTDATQEQVDAGRATEGPDLYAEANRIAEEYGLTECAG